MKKEYSDIYTYENTVCPICGSSAIILFLESKFVLYKCGFEDCEYKFKNHIN